MPEPLSSNASGGSVTETPARVSTAEDVNKLLKGPDEPPVKDDKIKDDNVKDDDDKTREADDDEEIKLKNTEDEDEKLDLDDDYDDETKEKKKLKSKDNLDDDDDEKLDDDIELDTPPRKKEVTAAYPDFFKKFPWFEKMMFRDREYTNLFGSFDDAKDAAEQVKILQTFERDLVNGNTGRVLAQVKQNDPKAFNRIVDNYLPTLYKVDKEAYIEVVGNINKHVIREMAQAATQYDATDKEAAKVLRQGALILNRFLFGSDQYTPPKNRVDPNEEKQNSEVQQERLDFVRERFDTARVDLQTKVDKVLRATIADYIDPKGEMSSYTKKNAVRDALTNLHTTVGEDTTFRRNLDKLWDNVFATRFSKDSLTRVERTYLGKAKTQLKAVIRQARREALQERPSNRTNGDGQDRDREREERPKKGPIETGRPHQSRGKESMTRKPGESVADFLARD